MKVQPRALAFTKESAFQVLARAREIEATGRSVVHLEIGQPDFPTPSHICDAAVAAIRDGQTGYGPSPGLPVLREAIARDAGRRRGLSFRKEQVIVTPGGKPVLYYAIHALAGAGDEVIYPDPGFPMYASIARASGATLVPLPLRHERELRFDVDDFRARVSPRTRLVILNSPGNPTGSVLAARDLEAVAEEARKRDFVVLSDEIYSRLVYAPPGHVGDFLSIASLPGMAERTIVLDGFSKTYAMTGWRLGYGIVPDPLIEVFDSYNVNIVSCAATFTQLAAVAAIEGPQEPVDAMVREFRRRRDLLVAGLNRLPGVECHLPGGAFYAFPNVRGTGLSSDVLARKLLDDAGVATLSGTAFGPEGDGHLRLSYASSIENLEEALARMERLLKAQ